MTRSVAEKTFEHWCSMHLSYRYRAKMLMWWPSDGADIEVVMAPQTWGKRFWLELKTTEWKPGPRQLRHDLMIDLDQLNRYSQQNTPYYYVFIAPEWKGTLSPSSTSASSVWLAGLAPERLAYQSWSQEKWFAEWTYVVPGWALHRALSTQINALPSGPARKKPFCIAEVKSGKISWRTSKLKNDVPVLKWKEFWRTMDECGGIQWPSQFLLPPGVGTGSRTGHKVDRADLLVRLRGLIENPIAFNGEVVRFNWIEGDSYVAEADGDNFRPEFNWDGNSRAIVALSERALTL